AQKEVILAGGPTSFKDVPDIAVPNGRLYQMTITNAHETGRPSYVELFVRNADGDVRPKWRRGAPHH
ncbi:hypothetical protein AAVH_31893, partial [Aphelenchoides avenae]